MHLILLVSQLFALTISHGTTIIMNCIACQALKLSNFQISGAVIYLHSHIYSQLASTNMHVQLKCPSQLQC